MIFRLSTNQHKQVRDACSGSRQDHRIQTRFACSGMDRRPAAGLESRNGMDREKSRSYGTEGSCTICEACLEQKGFRTEGLKYQVSRPESPREVLPTMLATRLIMV